MRELSLRTPAEKSDLAWAWSRSDEAFFAAGACHVLAAAFLLTYPNEGFRPWRLVPSTGQRGGHLVVMRDELVFDCAGYATRTPFLAEYFTAMRRLVADWDAHFVPLELDPIGWEFCGSNQHRHPSQFLHDPLPRALALARRFPPRPTIL